MLFTWKLPPNSNSKIRTRFLLLSTDHVVQVCKITIHSSEPVYIFKLEMNLSIDQEHDINLLYHLFKTYSTTLSTLFFVFTFFSWYKI